MVKRNGKQGNSGAIVLSFHPHPADLWVLSANYFTMRLVAPDTGQIPKDFVVYLGMASCSLIIGYFSPAILLGGHWATRLWGLWQFWFFLRGHYIVAHVPGSLFDRFDVSGPHDDPAAFERVARASDWGVELVVIDLPYLISKLQYDS
jgi:hypothetical protein